MGREAIWAGVALFAVVLLAVPLVRVRRRSVTAAPSRDEKLRRARRAAGQIARDRKRMGMGSLRGKGGGGSDGIAQDLASGGDGGGSSGGGSD